MALCCRVKHPRQSLESVSGRSCDPVALRFFIHNKSYRLISVRMPPKGPYLVDQSYPLLEYSGGDLFTEVLPRTKVRSRLYQA